MEIVLYDAFDDPVMGQERTGSTDFGNAVYLN